MITDRYDLEEDQDALVQAMRRGYHYEVAADGVTEDETPFRLITRPKFIWQDATRICEAFMEAALDYVEREVTDVNGEPDDPIFEREQMALDYYDIINKAIRTGIAAAKMERRELRKLAKADLKLFGLPAELLAASSIKETNGEQAENVEGK